IGLSLCAQEGAPLFTAVIRDISERRRHDDQLANAQRAADMAAVAKREFLALMSHEIRTPLNAIMGMNELLSKVLPEGEPAEWLQQSQRSARRLLEMMNDLLVLAGLEHKSEPNRRARFHLGNLLEDLAQSHARQAQDKSLDFELRLDPGLPHWVLGEPSSLRRIMSVLLGNAIKFTRRGRVMLEAVAAPWERVVIAVSDTGIGMSAEQIQALFRPFAVGDATLSRRQGGAGTGLAMANHLLGIVGGRIQVDSILGEGSTFTLDLPLPPAPESRVESPETIGNVASVEPLRILLAEDSAENARLVQAYLRGTGHVLILVGDGQTAVETFCQQAFDLVFMDIQMPIMDGWEATRRLRAWEVAQNKPRCPVVALTAHALPADELGSLEAGCDAHATKPIDRAGLLQLIAIYGKPRP
ncbi:MAG: response regulator, partial [Magnetococcus sp. WYHC-3]